MAAAVDRNRVLWKATPQEEHFALSHDNRTDLTCYSVTIALRSPLEEDHMKRALLHLFRKCPNLRVCHERDEQNQLWTCRMREENIFLEFRQTPDGYEKRYIGETRKYHQVTTGPMWRVTVMPTDGVLFREEADQGFGFQYHVLIGFHHSITDGHSSMRICGFLISLLNDVIEGKHIDDERQLAEFTNDCINKALFYDASTYMRENPTVYESFEKRYQEFLDFTPLLFQMYPGINPMRAGTGSVQSFIPKETFEKFYGKAKSCGITIHSAFCSAVHAAIIDLLIQARCPDEQFDLTSSHQINLRRYWPGNSEHKFGPHIGLHRTRHVLPRNMKHNFWLHAQQFHKTFLDELNDKECIKFDVIKHGRNPIPPKTVEEFLKCHRKSPFNYGISNMGDVTKLFKKSNGSEHNSARIVNIRRTTSMPPGIYCSTFCIQTLNSRLLIAFDFQTRYFTPSTARKILEGTVNVINTFAR